MQAAANGGQAAAIVMDVHTGEVLALVSLPMYDNNIFSGKIDEARLQQYLDDPKKPLVNHALAEQYAPGSIFKQITGAAALQEGVAVPSTTITSNGYITVPEPVRPVDPLHLQGLAHAGHARLLRRRRDVVGRLLLLSRPAATTPSARTSMASASSGSRGTRGSSASAARPASTSPARRTATSRTPAWKKETFGDDWFLGDTYNMGIGQGFVAATPIQMVRVTAAVANGGTLLTPRVVREVRDAQRHVIVPAEPKIEGNVGVSPANLAILRDAMTQAVSWGSANLGGAARPQGRRQDRHRRVRRALRRRLRTRRTPGSAASRPPTTRRSRSRCSSSAASARRTPRRSRRRSSTTTSTARSSRRDAGSAAPAGVTP